jgi:hypothetical protein
MTKDNPKPAPKCARCSYSFAGMATLERCPECGTPVLESLAAERQRDHGIRQTSSKIVAGWPLYDFIVSPGRLPGSNHARGWIAIGPKATGGVAIGAFARGYIAIGAISIGGITLGAISIGVLSLGSLAIGGISSGIFSVGAFAQGQVGVGLAAQGTVAVGLIAKGKVVVAPAELAGKTRAEVSTAFFDAVSSVFGKASIGPILPTASLAWAVLVPTLLCLVVALEVRRRTRAGPTGAKGKVSSKPL